MTAQHRHDVQSTPMAILEDTSQRNPMTGRWVPSHMLRRATNKLDKDQKGAALLLTLLAIVAIAGISMTMLAVILGQVLPTYQATKGTRTVNAAESGLQAGVGMLRTQTRTAVSAGKTVVLGDQSKLPCGPITGQVDDGSTGIGYTVSFRYLTENPSGKTDSWVNSKAMSCHAAQTGTQPTYVVITSQGTAPAVPGAAAAAGNRTVEAVYEFTVTNVNITGGRIWLANHSQGCWAASSAANNAGIVIKDQTWCNQSSNDALANWNYTNRWHLVLSSTAQEGETSSSLCIAGTSGQAMLATCKLVDATAADDPEYLQRWAWNADYNWYGMSRNSSGGWHATYTLASNTSRRLYPSSGKLMIGGTSVRFDPAAAVGPGAASGTNGALINYKEFGRCADVTNQNFDYAGAISSIAYPCKQDATGKFNLDWNQVWSMTEPACNYADGSNYTSACDSPTTTNTTTALERIQSGGRCLATNDRNADSQAYVSFRPCGSQTSNPEQWFTRYTAVADQSRSWAIVDQWGRCLTADSNSLYSGWSYLRMMPCSAGNLAQKWNAPPQTTSSNFGGYREVGE